MPCFIIISANKCLKIFYSNKENVFSLNQEHSKQCLFKINFIFINKILAMENEIHEQYEYARRRLKQKKRLYYHFVFFVLISLFLFIANQFFDNRMDSNWCIWIITVWLFLFILHFIKIFITDRFMNKNWERDQINRLVALQQKKIAQLQLKIEDNNSK